MPYVSSRIKIAGGMYDRRKRLSHSDRKRIKLLYQKGLTIRGIARVLHHISRRSIQFVLFPERLEKVKKRAIEVKRWTEGNKKENHTPAMRKHRQYKHELYVKNLIK